MAGSLRTDEVLFKRVACRATDDARSFLALPRKGYLLFLGAYCETVLQGRYINSCTVRARLTGELHGARFQWDANDMRLKNVYKGVPMDATVRCPRTFTRKGLEAQLLLLSKAEEGIVIAGWPVRLKKYMGRYNILCKTMEFFQRIDYQYTKFCEISGPKVDLIIFCANYFFTSKLVIPRHRKSGGWLNPFSWRAFGTKDSSF